MSLNLEGTSAQQGKSKPSADVNTPKKQGHQLDHIDRYPSEYSTVVVSWCISDTSDHPTCSIRQNRLEIIRG